MAGSALAAEPPRWNEALRALREATSVTQDGWAAHLGVGRRTVQRWEQGLAVPDAAARRAILALCQGRGLYRRFDAGPLAGLAVTPEWLGDLLAAAHLDDHATAPSTVDAPPTTTVPGPQAQALPVPLTSLVGRERQIDTVARLLESARLVTLTGPGGTGKTRLALAVAERVRDRYPDGVVFVDLSPVVDANLVHSAIAQALGVQEMGGRSLLAALNAYLGGKRVLLIVDNFEQVVEAAPMLADLLTASPTLSLLVTSRALLRLSGEHEYPVPPLSVPDAAGATARSLAAVPSVALFVDRAQLARPGFLLTDENASAVASICAALDGLPLAVELAAARCRVLSTEALHARLVGRATPASPLRLLTGGPRDHPRRQQTLRDTIQWSYDLLTAPEQRLFGRLAVFAGGCTLAAAEAVCDAGGDLGLDVLDGMASLMEQSLLREEDGPDGEPRFTMLATIREFGLERLTVTGEVGAVRERHAAFVAEMTVQAEVGLLSGETLRWRARLTADLDNIRAALSWCVAECDAERGSQIVWNLYALWWRYGHLSEGRRWAEALLSLPDLPRVSIPRARLLRVAGALAQGQGDLVTARRETGECVAVSRQVGDARLLAYGLVYAASAAAADETPKARRMIDEGLRHFRASSDEWGLGIALMTLGIVAACADDDTTAESSWWESVAVYRRLGDRSPSALPLGNLAEMAVSRGDDATAELLYDEILEIYRAGEGAAYQAPSALNGLAALYLRRGDEARASAATAEALELARQMALPPAAGVAMLVAASLLVRRGASRDAVRLVGAGEALAGREALDRLARRRSPDVAFIDDLGVTLGEDDFAAAWAEGRALSLDAAVALALGQFEEAGMPP